MIIRAEMDGVFYGTLSEKNGNEVTLTDCRRIWSWEGAASVSQLAVEGTKLPEKCRFTVSVPQSQPYLYSLFSQYCRLISKFLSLVFFSTNSNVPMNKYIFLFSVTLPLIGYKDTLTL